MTERYRVMNHDDYELDYIADSQQSFKKVDLYDCCDLLNELTEENQKLKQFQNKVFDLIDTKIKEETYSAEMIKKTLNINEDYVEPVNILTIKALEQLKKELQND